MADGSSIPNPSYALQPLVARSAREIWISLFNTYVKPSRVHINKLRQSLRKSVKGTQIVHEYMSDIITKSDQMALLGSPLEHEDLLDVIVTGLSDDYRVIIEMVNGRDKPISVEELHEKLLHQENTLALSTSLTTSSQPVTANNAQGCYAPNQQSRGGYRGQQ